MIIVYTKCSTTTEPEHFIWGKQDKESVEYEYNILAQRNTHLLQSDMMILHLMNLKKGLQ